MLEFCDWPYAKNAKRGLVKKRWWLSKRCNQLDAASGRLLEEAAVLEGSVDPDGLLELGHQTQHLRAGRGNALGGALGQRG
jgi:hypothetical protein